MNYSIKSRFVIILIVTVGLVGSADVRAQSRDDAQKRMFAARLRRRERTEAKEAARPAAERGAASRRAEARQPARSRVDVSPAALRATGPNLGRPAATPVVPHGHRGGRGGRGGRDRR